MLPTVIRIGDRERDRYREHLAQMFAGGYITREEFDERSDRVTTARTGNDLEILVSDLPLMDIYRPYTPQVPEQPSTVAAGDDSGTWWAAVLWFLVVLFAAVGFASTIYFLAGA